MTQAIFQQVAAQNSSLPDKKYFKIGEASSLLGVKPHVLRYWESEFPQIRPYKSRTGQRLYRHRDVQALQHIQRLLYQERYTIAGARQALRLMFENEQPISEEILSEEAIEAAVAFELPAQTQVHAPMIAEPVELGPPSSLPVPVHAQPVTDVLEVVEVKLAQSQMVASLRNAQRSLREMLQALEA
jgi:DNA-binding transcriptional MerR regulator